MKYFEELGAELKSGFAFSIIAFALSTISGLIGKVPLGMIIFRSLVIIPLFFLVGFGTLNIIRKFVPEVFEVITNFSDAASDDDLMGNENILSDNIGGLAPENTGENFTGFTENDYDRVNSASNTNTSNTENSASDNEFDTSGGKLGKHIIVDKSSNAYGYEPKIMAEAIRTMMSKD